MQHLPQAFKNEALPRRKHAASGRNDQNQHWRLHEPFRLDPGSSVVDVRNADADDGSLLVLRLTLR